MIPPDNSNGDSLAETQFAGPKPLVHGRHSGDCTPPAAEGDNVIDFASGDRVAGEALVLMANTKSHRPLHGWPVATSYTARRSMAVVIHQTKR